MKLSICICILALLLASCSRQDAASSDPMYAPTRKPEPPTKPSPPLTGGSGVEAPYATVVPADSDRAAGAETSTSKGTGPGNGSAAVGGLAGGPGGGGGGPAAATTHIDGGGSASSPSQTN